MKKQKIRKVAAASAIFGSFLLLGFVSALFFAPIIKTNADSNANTKIKATVSPVISLALDSNTMEFNITPTATGSFNSQSVVATVNTNSTGGYELFFSAEDNTTTMTSLTSESTIASDFSGTVTSSTMAANKWGYSLDNTNFSIIPTLATPTKIKDLDHFPSSAEKTTTVNIAVKADTSLPSGTYTKNVVFSVIAHPTPETIHTIATMQDMTPDVCNETTTPATNATAFDWDGSYHNDTSRVPRNSLQDTRDGKFYLVSKLADGNCWMSQNLELMLDSTKSLSNLTTDLNTKTSWTPENSTLTVVPTSSTWPANNETASSAAYSYYPITTDRYYQGGTSKSSTPTNSGVEYDWEKAGIYYNWYSATAGSGTYAMTSGNAEDSICPKGWMLPLGTTENKSFHYLITTKYGLDNGTAFKLVDAPFNILRAGIYVWTGTMLDQGSTGYLSSSSAYSQDNIYDLSFVSLGLDPRYSGSKGEGFSVRCVAR